MNVLNGHSIYESDISQEQNGV